MTYEYDAIASGYMFQRGMDQHSNRMRAESYAHQQDLHQSHLEAMRHAGGHGGALGQSYDSTPSPSYLLDQLLANGLYSAMKASPKLKALVLEFTREQIERNQANEQATVEEYVDQALQHYRESDELVATVRATANTLVARFRKEIGYDTSFLRHILAYERHMKGFEESDFLLCLLAVMDVSRNMAAAQGLDEAAWQTKCVEAFEDKMQALKRNSSPATYYYQLASQSAPRVPALLGKLPLLDKALFGKNAALPLYSFNMSQANLS